MSEYKRRYTNAEKRKKLAIFNSVYYEGDPNNWKVSRLPNWMSFYGYELDKELHGESPKYFRQFKQGTIVMIDYGVPVGNELGGRHFGVVLSNNDTKFKQKIMVVPLSSHYHRGYVDLGYDLMKGISSLILNRIDELIATLEVMRNRLIQFEKKSSKRSFDFSPEEFDFLKSHNIDTSLLHDGNVTIYFEKRNPIFEKLIKNIKAIDSWENYSNIFEFVSYFDTIFSLQKEAFEKLKFKEDTIAQLEELSNKLNKYNKQSFAVISDIKTVSKLKVVKLNHFTISGNTYISDEALTKIKYELIKTIE